MKTNDFKTYLVNKVRKNIDQYINVNPNNEKYVLILMAKSTRIDICMSIKYGEVIPINHYTYVHHYRNLVLKILSNINITVDFMVYSLLIVV